jgi:hypothetical protein
LLERLLSLSAATLLLSCAPTPLERYEASLSNVSPVVLRTCDEFQKILSVEDLENAFGALLERESHPIPNSHVEGQVDQLYTDRFEGAEAIYLVSKTATRPIMITHMRIESRSGAAVALQLIGEPSDQIPLLLGLPDAETPQDLVYFCGEVNSIRFEILNGSVSAVIWQPYVG